MSLKREATYAKKQITITAKMRKASQRFGGLWVFSFADTVALVEL